MGVLDDLVQRELGVPVRPVTNPEVTQIETSATRILRNNPNRVALTFFNLGAQTVHLFYTNSVASTLGFTVEPNGGSIMMTYKEDYQMVGWEWWAIATGGVSACVAIEQLADVRSEE